MLHAVLLDVGGTLWPDGAPVTVTFSDGRQVTPDAYAAHNLKMALPDCSDDQVSELALELRRAAENTLRLGLEIDTRGAIGKIAVDLGLGTFAPETIDAIRRAMIVPFVNATPFFPGVPALFKAIRLMRLECVLVSNTVWRDATAYRDELATCEFANVIGGIVTSVDAGFNKPHPRMFESALSLARRGPSEAVMIGNSERNDILPARAMGIRTIRVCIQEPLASDSAADAVVTSLEEVSALLTSWT